jgi:DMSO/TMAO reductase YedYZ molybdopterin-dependent catalytic subunit
MRHVSLRRRDFLRRTAAAGFAVAGMPAIGPSHCLWAADAADAAAPTADQIIAGKDARLIVHKPTPSEIETPGELLWEHAETPARLLFVRNNQQPGFAMTLAPYEKSDEWTVELGGLIEFPRTLRWADFKQLPQTETTVVLQCSGNGRKFFSEAAACSGAPWSVGAVANLRFGGVRLRDVVDHLKPTIDPRAKFVTAEGRDVPGNPTIAAKSDAADFEHSIPLADALEHALLADTLNGEPLPTVHGGPLRLVVPGYYGTMHVKWVSRLRFESVETANHHQVRRYRTPHERLEPGSKFEYDLTNSEPNWRMKIKSLILAPSSEAQVAAGSVAVKGVAFNDGRAAIERVEVSTDGRSWRTAELEKSAGPFAWTRWTAQVDLPAGEHELACRALDAQGRTQPLDGQVHWNPAGYAWNGVHRVKVKAT